MKADRGRGGERDGGVFYGFSARVIHHRIHYICEFRWTCIDDLFCFLNTLRGGSSGVVVFVIAGGTSPSPLLLPMVPLLLGSVRLRRMLPSTECTGLPGTSETGARSSFSIPSMRVLCTMELKNGRVAQPWSIWWWRSRDLLLCLWDAVLLLMILGCAAFPMSFQLPPFASSSEVEITSVSSSLPINPVLDAGGGVTSSMNQSWCAIRNSRTS